MLLVDTKEKMFMKDEVLKSHIANLRPCSRWLQEVNFIHNNNILFKTLMYMDNFLEVLSLDLYGAM